MVFDVSVGLTWILFLALFPMAFFWLRAAWRIQIKRDYSEVGLKGGVPSPHPEKFAPYTMVLNLVAGCVAVFVIYSVLFTQVPYEKWSAMAGVMIWCKFIGNFVLGRHAHARPRVKKAG